MSHVKCLVDKKLHYNMLLGADWLWQHRAIIDLNKQCLIFPENEIYVPIMVKEGEEIEKDYAELLRVEKERAAKGKQKQIGAKRHNTRQRSAGQRADGDKQQCEDVEMTDAE